MPREGKKGAGKAETDVYTPKKERPGSSSVWGIRGIRMSSAQSTHHDKRKTPPI
jgi:hypothetical protein